MKRTLISATLLTIGCIVPAAVILTLSGCRSLLPGEIVNPSYALRSVVPHVAIALPLSASAIDLDFTIVVDNPNAIGLRLDWLDFDLAINDTPILTSVRAEQGVHIPAHGVGDVHLVRASATGTSRLSFARSPTWSRATAPITRSTAMPTTTPRSGRSGSR